MLCDDLDGWNRRVGWEGGPKGRAIYVYIQLIHFVVQQKLTQHCKATIHQKRKKTTEPIQSRKGIMSLGTDKE